MPGRLGQVRGIDEGHRAGPAPEIHYATRSAETDGPVWHDKACWPLPLFLETYRVEVLEHVRKRLVSRSRHAYAHVTTPNGRRFVVPVAVLLLVAACVVGLGRSAGAASAGVLPPGWAGGGSAAGPQTQVVADTSCGANSVLLFSARGSGDQYGALLAKNKIGAWTQGAGIVLIKNGWNVRDLQAIYPAPPVPSFTKIAAAVIAGGGLTAKSAAAVALIVKQFRDAVSGSWRSVKAELEAAYQRCPGRKIMLAGYSQGAILLRYIVPRLNQQILKQIVSIDLFADPTEQRAVDSRLQHPPSLDGKLTTEGLDTLSGSVLNGGSFRQTSYPATITRRTYQYCMDGDLVCDVNLSNLNPTNTFNEGKIHASYGFQFTGIRAAQRLGAAPGARRTPKWIYWASDGKIGRAKIDGTDANPAFITLPYRSSPLGVAVDDRHVYWSDEGNDAIGRARLDGSDVAPAFIKGRGALTTTGVAIDAQHIYWTNRNAKTIGRANLDGSHVNQAFIRTNASMTGDMAIDAGHIYWTGSGAISRASLDGTHLELNWIPVASNLTGISISGGNVYWGDFQCCPPDPSQSGVGRASIGGEGVNPDFVPGREAAGVVTGGGWLFWTASTVIYRSRSNGTGIQPIVSRLPYVFFGQMALGYY